MKKFRPNAIATAILASGLSVASNYTFAQETDNLSADAENDTIEKIEVRGFSTSLIKSLNQKRFSDTVSEQLSADDLGGLPDVSMADALTRLPGISAVRTGGQAAEINIRGLSGDFVFSTLNGREQVSTSGSRSIEFDQYPSELISSAAVYKSPKASLIEGGVAGTVELQTASPLSIDEDYKFSANVRGMYNDRAGEVSDATEFGSRLSFSFQTKFLDDTLGIALGYARLFQPSVSTQFVGLANNRTKNINGVDYNVSEGFEIQHQGGEETRNGYMAVVEWAPTENFILKADAFLSKFDSEEFARGFRVKLEADTASLNNPVILGDSVIGGTISRSRNNATRVELVNDDNQDFDEVASFGINAAWQATDNLSMSFDVSLSTAESDFRNGLLWALVAEDATIADPVFDTNVQISYLLNGLDLPDVGFNQADAFSDLDRVMVSKYGIYPFQNEDEVQAYRFDLKYELDNDFISSIEVGVRYSDREYANDRSVFEYGSDSSFSDLEPPLRLNSDIAQVVNWEGEYSFFPSYLSIDLDKALNAWFPQGIPQPVKTWGVGAAGVLNAPDDVFPRPDTAWSVAESGKVFEDVLSAYMMANIDTEIGGIPVTGNIGVRRVESEQSSTVLERATRTEQMIDDAGNIVSVEVSAPELGAQNITDDAGLVNNFYRPALLTDKYTDYLPSLNLNFKIAESSQLRFAAAKVMGRAPINRLFANARNTVDVVTATRDEDTGEIVLSSPTAKLRGTNTNSPFLRPFYANQYDLSYEQYFEETDGAFVAALFYKDIQSFIEQSTTDPYDFAANGFDVPESVTVVVTDRDGPIFEGGQPLTIEVPTENGPYTQAQNNAEGGYIRGIELSYTQIYSFLPAPFDGLGMNASYSYTESEIQNTLSPNDGIYSTDLPGLSENVATATFFYEYEDFETRLSVRYRDAFVSKQIAVNQQTVNFDSETVVDFQTSYNINDNLGLLFQVNNVTDEPTKSYFGTQSQTGTIQYFGTQYFFGLTYSL